MPNTIGVREPNEVRRPSVGCPAARGERRGANELGYGMQTPLGFIDYLSF